MLRWTSASIRRKKQKWYALLNSGARNKAWGKLLKALNSIQDGKSADGFNDEIETLITLVVNAKDEDINDAWEDYHTETE